MNKLILLGVLLVLVACGSPDTAAPAVEAPAVSTARPTSPTPGSASTSKLVYPETLSEITTLIFTLSTTDPFEPKTEFETQQEYENRLRDIYDQYAVEADRIYGNVETLVYELGRENYTVGVYDAENGRFALPIELNTGSHGPDFSLVLPTNTKEYPHYFNDFANSFGARTAVDFYAYVSVETAREVRLASDQSNILIRLDLMFEFPPGFEGYRFLSDRIEQGGSFSQNQNYAYGEGKIVVKVVSAELYSRDGRVFYRWE